MGSRATPRRRTSAALAVALMTACGSGAPSRSPQAAATRAATPPEASSDIEGAVPAPPIEDAAALRDSLLQLAEANVTEDPGEGFQPSFGVFEAWQEAYPDLTFAGYAVEPGPETVSVYSNLQNAKDVGGPDNPYLMAFAVLDTAGTCSGGVMAGWPAPATFERVEMTGEEQPCHPLAVSSAGGYETFG